MPFILWRDACAQCLHCPYIQLILSLQDATSWDVDDVCLFGFVLWVAREGPLLFQFPVQVVMYRDLGGP